MGFLVKTEDEAEYIRALLKMRGDCSDSTLVLAHYHGRVTVPVAAYKAGEVDQVRAKESRPSLCRH